MLLTAAADVARAEHFPGVLARCLSNLTVATSSRTSDGAVDHRDGGSGGRRAHRRGPMEAYAGLNLMLALMASGRWEELPSDVRPSGRPRSSPRRRRRRSLASSRHARRSRSRCPGTGRRHRSSDDLSHASWMSMTCGVPRPRPRMISTGAGATRSRPPTAYAAGAVSDDFVHMWPVAVDLALRVGDTTHGVPVAGDRRQKPSSCTRSHRRCGAPPPFRRPADPGHRLRGCRAASEPRSTASRDGARRTTALVPWPSSASCGAGPVARRGGAARGRGPGDADRHAGARPWLEELRLAEQRTR